MVGGTKAQVTDPPAQEKAVVTADTMEEYRIPGGNAEDTVRNLYRGAAFGVRTYFFEERELAKIAEIANPKENVLQRLVFKHKNAECLSCGGRLSWYQDEGNGR